MVSLKVVLLLAYLAQPVTSANICNLKGFKCERNSPVAPDPDIHTLQRSSDMHFAVTFPLTHVFCGQINGKGKAEGFHYRPNGENPSSAKVKEDSEIPYHESNYGFPAFRGCSVFNGDEFIPREASTEYYGFFPNQWIARDLVNKISKCVAKCCSMKTTESKNCRNRSEICLYNFTQSNSKMPFAVQVFLTLTSEGGKNKKREKMPIIINSAFPVRWKKNKKGKIMDDCKNGVRCDSQKINC